MKFRKGNNYRYEQDFRFQRGLPTGVDFTVSRVPGHPDSFHLTAQGYGILGPGDNYGCGGIYVYGLDARQRRRFARNAAEK